MPFHPSTITFDDVPMPSANRPGAASASDAADCAMHAGPRVNTGTMAVPEPQRRRPHRRQRQRRERVGAHRLRRPQVGVAEVGQLHDPVALVVERDAVEGDGHAVALVHAGSWQDRTGWCDLWHHRPGAMGAQVDPPGGGGAVVDGGRVVGERRDRPGPRGFVPDVRARSARDRHDHHRGDHHDHRPTASDSADFADNGRCTSCRPHHDDLGAAAGAVAAGNGRGAANRPIRPRSSVG